MWAKLLGLELKSRFEGRSVWKVGAPRAPSRGLLLLAVSGVHEMRVEGGLQEILPWGLGREVRMCVRERRREAERQQRKTKRGSRHAEKLELTGETQEREKEMGKWEVNSRHFGGQHSVPQLLWASISVMFPFKGERTERPQRQASLLPSFFPSSHSFFQCPARWPSIATHSTGDKCRGTRVGQGAWTPLGS